MAEPKVVGVVSQKGGVGKSTLCQLIAREAAIDGKRAKILDFDVKQTTAEMIMVCDFIILPTGSSRAYLVPGLALARRTAEIKPAADGLLFALCRVMTASEAADAHAFIAKCWVRDAGRRADRAARLPAGAK